jgi:hypothetical protein
LPAFLLFLRNKWSTTTTCAALRASVRLVSTASLSRQLCSVSHGTGVLCFNTETDFKGFLLSKIRTLWLSS